ncbi:hypothetical protein [Microbacterium sp.]|uniref:hypothetical protein n=1 Tax=Microbacterium sp. TaxID=51671 RepID=UPI003A8E60C4
MFSRSRSEPFAIAKARKLVGRRLSKAIPGYRFGFVLALEPDQYRVSFTLWNEWRGDRAEFDPAAVALGS